MNQEQPGPWHRAPSGESIFDRDGKRIARVARTVKGWRTHGDVIAAAPALLAALKLAQATLNTAPRFRVPSLPKEHDDSYKVAAAVDAAIRAAEGGK